MTETGQNEPQTAGTPRWVKVFSVIALLVVVVVVIMVVTGRGGPPLASSPHLAR